MGHCVRTCNAKRVYDNLLLAFQSIIAATRRLMLLLRKAAGMNNGSVDCMIFIEIAGKVTLEKVDPGVYGPALRIGKKFKVYKI